MRCFDSLESSMWSQLLRLKNYHNKSALFQVWEVFGSCVSLCHPEQISPDQFFLFIVHHFKAAVNKVMLLLYVYIAYSPLTVIHFRFVCCIYAVD